jgi:hypothetical protein
MSNTVELRPSDLNKLGVTITQYAVEELHLLAVLVAGEPFLHIVHPDKQELHIPVPELERLIEAISHLDVEQKILLIYQEGSGKCAFQYPDADGNEKAFFITNQLQFKASSLN